jgi:hypothetical protein
VDLPEDSGIARAKRLVETFHAHGSCPATTAPPGSAWKVLFETTMGCPLQYYRAEIDSREDTVDEKMTNFVLRIEMSEKS